MNTIQLIPTILQSDLEEVRRQVNLAQQIPGVSLVQIDIMDGQLTEERSISLTDLTEVEFGDLKLDVHLLTEEPMDFVWELIEFKDYLPIQSVTAQIERMSHQADYLEELRKHDWQAGLSLELATPIEEIDPASFADTQIIQLMAIQLGSQGQTLNPLVYDRLDELSKVIAALPKSDIHDTPPAIWVDGGVRPTNLAQLKAHGATGVTVGSHLWRATDTIEAYRQLQELS